MILQRVATRFSTNLKAFRVIEQQVQLIRCEVCNSQEIAFHSAVLVAKTHRVAVGKATKRGAGSEPAPQVILSMRAWSASQSRVRVARLPTKESSPPGDSLSARCDHG